MLASDIMTNNKITQLLQEFVKTGAIRCDIKIFGEVFDLQISRKNKEDDDDDNYYDEGEEPTREDFEDALSSWPYD